MDNKINKNKATEYENLTNQTIYNIEGTSFIVNSIFNQNSSDTLGMVLLRLINDSS